MPYPNSNEVDNSSRQYVGTIQAKTIVINISKNDTEIIERLNIINKMTHSIKVTNIKCGGCANSIVKKLETLEGISDVSVDVEEGNVQWESSQQNSNSLLINQLAKMGYPESDPTFIQTAKSYVSCAVGRMTK